MVQCVGQIYALHVGEGGTLYIEEYNQKALRISVSDEENEIKSQGQWVNINVDEEE